LLIDHRSLGLEESAALSNLVGRENYLVGNSLAQQQRAPSPSSAGIPSRGGLQWETPLGKDFRTVNQPWLSSEWICTASRASGQYLPGSLPVNFMARVFSESYKCQVEVHFCSLLALVAHPLYSLSLSFLICEIR
jgi:hypothetical protein